VVAAGATGEQPAAIDALSESSGATTVVVVVDGIGVDVRRCAEGVAVTSGADAVADEDLDAPGGVPGDAFGALNDAFSLPLRIDVAAGTRPGTVAVLHWIRSGDAAVFPRTRMVVGAGAEVDLLELFVSSEVDSLVVPRTDIDLGAGAIAGYLNLQQLGSRVWQIAEQSSRVGRDATFTSFSVALGGDYARVRTSSSLVGTGATSRLLAVYFASGTRMVDFRTVQEHRAARTTSDLLFKGAVANRSQAVYTGVIRVDKGAAGTNAFQTNRNLVLHSGARADSVPNLEIEDNDVRCSHASAVGPISEDQRFYLASRGVPPDAADRLITLGFLDEVLARIPSRPVADHARRELVAVLDRAEAAEAAGARSGAEDSSADEDPSADEEPSTDEAPAGEGEQL
jgi:Fe-S cluster assembly protein SufD